MTAVSGHHLAPALLRIYERNRSWFHTPHPRAHMPARFYLQSRDVVGTNCRRVLFAVVPGKVHGVACTDAAAGFRLF